MATRDALHDGREDAARPPVGIASSFLLNLANQDRALVAQLIATISIELGGPLSAVGEQPIDDELGRRDVLDGEPDRLEDGDRLGVAGLGPRTVDAPDLHQLRLRQ